MAGRLLRWLPGDGGRCPDKIIRDLRCKYHIDCLFPLCRNCSLVGGRGTLKYSTPNKVRKGRAGTLFVECRRVPGGHLPVEPIGEGVKLRDSFETGRREVRAAAALAADRGVDNF